MIWKSWGQSVSKKDKKRTQARAPRAVSVSKPATSGGRGVTRAFDTSQNITGPNLLRLGKLEPPNVGPKRATAAALAPVKATQPLAKSAAARGRKSLRFSDASPPTENISLPEPASSGSSPTGTRESKDCHPSPDPRSGDGSSGRRFVPWKARGDLKCR